MRLKHFLSVFLTLLTLSVGQMWGAAEIVYTLDGTTTGGSAGYDVASDIEQDEISWKVTGNTTMNPWRLGGKGGSSKNATSNLTRTIYNTDPIADDITSIVIKTGTKTLNALTNINVKVTTGSNGSGTVKQTFTNTLQASHTYTFDKPAGQDWSDCYYLITFTFQAKGTGNQYIQFLSADFYAEVSSCEKIGAPTVTATPGDRQIVLEWAKQTEAASYTVTCTGGTVGEITGTTTKSCTITGLTNGISYTWTVTPVGDGTTYCAEGNTAASASATPNVSRTITYYDKDGQHTTSLADGTNIATALNALYGVNGPTSCDTEDYEYFVGWKDGEISGTATSVTLLSTEVVNATTAAKSYYAVWSDTEPADYSTTYSSNVSGVSGVNVSIGGSTYGAKKLGSNGSGGSFSVTAPSGTTKLYLHAQGWNNKSATLTLSTNVGSISPTEAQSLTANAAISGSVTTFTLTTLTNDFFEYSLSNITSDATITIATQSERGVIWGVNAVSSSGDANYITSCCTSLGQINGSFFWTTHFCPAWPAKHRS